MACEDDWTNCGRTPSYNSLERLDHERKLLFSTPFSFGQHRIKQEVQGTPLCLSSSGPAAGVENRRWTLGGGTSATITIQGSCNKLCDTAPDPAEYAARNAGARPRQTLRRNAATRRGLARGHHLHPAYESWLFPACVMATLGVLFSAPRAAAR